MWRLVMSHPGAWLVQAANLKRAADLVGSRFQGEAGEWLRTADHTEAGREEAARAHELALPAFMLIGYAIEVVAKGLIVARAESDDDVATAITWMTTKHLGEELLDRASVSLSESERSLVAKQLYHAVRWSGRYPAPHPADSAILEGQVAKAAGSWLSDPRAVSTDHYREACELFARMEGDLREALAENRRKRLAVS